MTASAELAVVVPLYNEEGNVLPLVEAVQSALGEERDWRLLLVDDGSRDGTARRAAEAERADPRVRLIRLARNYGQSAAMQAGFDHARAEVIVSMDGDLQNDPQDIPRLLAKLKEGYDLVVGFREKRKESWLIRRLPSQAANRIIRWLTGVQIRDNGCSLKAYRSDVLSRVHLYSDMHRFIGPLAVLTAGARMAEIPVRDHPRRFGSSKYGLSRVWRVLADLLTLKMIQSFRERPLILFAAGAGGSSLLGGIFAAAALTVSAGNPGPGLDTSFVFPASSLLCFGLAVYLVMLGLISEVALRGRWVSFRIASPTMREERP